MGHQLPLGADAERFRYAPISGPYLKPIETADSCQELTSRSAAKREAGLQTCLFDYLVGAGEQRRRHLEAERLGSLEIDHDLEMGRQHDRQVSGLFAL